MMNKGYVEAEENVKDEDLKQAVSRAGYKAVSVENSVNQRIQGNCC